ncbi:MAG: hypothetical protein LBH54_02915, partial [Clostridiales bacterium]|nr:hypothetical protein [Clostridiales bacterium]
MTSKERVEKALCFEKTDRIPFNFWMDRRLLNRYELNFGKDFRVNHYQADVIETFPNLNWPQGEHKEENGSIWYTKPVFEDWEQADRLVMPEITADTFSDIKTKLDLYPDKAIFVNIPGPFTVLSSIRLLDNLYLDVYDVPSELHKLIKRIMDLQNKVIEEVVKLPITAIYFQDDIAASKGLIMSLDMIKEFIFDYFQAGIAMAKRNNKFVVYHSDGKITDALDTLLEMGVNAVNPLQPEFNDFAEFKRKYHKKLAVYGGIDNTKIIPDGTPEE